MLKHLGLKVNAENQKLLENLMHKSDKDLFLLLRDGKITLSQFESRVHSRRGEAHYTVLDDVYN